MNTIFVLQSIQFIFEREVMTKSGKIRHIFNELRDQVGDRASSREILEWAHALVEVASKESMPACNLRRGRIPFENLSLDIALADGGWKILSHEMRCGNHFDSEDWEGICPDMLGGYVNIEDLI